MDSPVKSKHIDFPKFPELLTVPKKHVFEEGKVVLWHDQDLKYKVPKAHIQLKLLSDSYNMESPVDNVLNFMLANMVKQMLSEVTYYAELAEVGFDIGNRTFGLMVHCYGYEKQNFVL